MIVAGTFVDQIDIDEFSLVSTAGGGGFVTSFDASGNVDWATQTGAAYGITADTNGNVFATGQFFGTPIFGDDILDSESSVDVFVSQIDAAGGSFIKSWRMGGESNDNGNSIASAADGSIYAAGAFVPAEADFPNRHLRTGGELGRSFIQTTAVSMRWRSGNGHLQTTRLPNSTTEEPAVKGRDSVSGHSTR